CIIEETIRRGSGDRFVALAYRRMVDMNWRSGDFEAGDGPDGLFAAGGAGEDLWEIMRLEEGAVGQDDGAIDGVFQLPDIAGPVIAGEQVHGMGRDAQNALAGFGGAAGDEMLDEAREVFHALAQG